MSWFAWSAFFMQLQTLKVFLVNEGLNLRVIILEAHF